MIERKCKECNKIFMVYPSIKKKFCSVECQHKNQCGSNNPNWKNGASSKIGVRKYNKKYRQENIGKINKNKCIICFNSCRNIYCSRKCRGIAETNKIKIICKTCGNFFYTIPAKKNKKFCSKKCYDISQFKRVKIICKVCGKLKLVPQCYKNQKFCSKNCNGIYYSGKNNSNWKNGKSFEPYPLNWNNRFKREIRKRDCYLCAICNRHQDEFNRSHDVHHIDGNKLNTTKENCISLCARHHSIVEQSGEKKYTFWMPRFKKILNKNFRYKI